MFGFLTGTYGPSSEGYHPLMKPYTKLQARSLNGGQTWNIETPNVDLNCSQEPSEAPEFDLTKSIIRGCGVYDTGGDDCVEHGGFYLSHDRGKEWLGPYKFTGLEKVFDGYECTTRTCVIDNKLFMSRRKIGVFASDDTFEAYHDGKNFHFKRWVCRDLNRATMPSVTEFNGHLYCALRRRSVHSNCLIEVFKFTDRWNSCGVVGRTGKYNGNPPALSNVDGYLVCAYGHRSTKSMMYAISDNGVTWSNFIMRGTTRYDIGYPQLFKLNNKELLCVYYWSDDDTRCRIESTKLSF